MMGIQAPENISERLYTADEFWQLSQQPEYADRRLELSKGRLIVMSPTGWEHGDITALLVTFVTTFVFEHGLGRVTTAEAGFILYKNPDPDGKDIVRAPDVGFIASARIPKKLSTKFVPFAPDLAVEVISPSESANDIHEKVTEYLQYGTRMVVLFYPNTQSAGVYTPTSFTPLTRDGFWDGGDVLPGFQLPLSRVYGDP
jgi:Uma2 family endonuclease